LNGKGGEMAIGQAYNEVSIQDNIISITLKGSLNESDYKNIAQKVKQFVAQCNEEGFCILVNDLQLIGSTLDAYKELEELNQWLNTQKMIAKAIVIERDTLLDTIQTLVPAIKDQKIKTFDAIEDAMLWLKSQLKNQV